MPITLSPDQIKFYQDEGYLLVEDCVPEDFLERIRNEIERFQQIAAAMTETDELIDLEDTHTPETPRIRRVKLPHTQSAPVAELLHSEHILSPVRDLLGPDLRLQSSKLNMKSAGFGAAVEWHQDWAFYPYTNDDVLAVGLLLDDMSLENGPLMVFPGSHKGPVLNHHHEGNFVGAVDLKAEGLDMEQAVAMTGRAGSISIHHARILHGSALNISTRDRRIIFFEMMAADAFPIVGGRGAWSGLEEFNERMLCGQTTLEPRVSQSPMRVAYPEGDKQGSIYEVQKAMGNRAFEVVK